MPVKLNHVPLDIILSFKWPLIAVDGQSGGAQQNYNHHHEHPSSLHADICPFIILTCQFKSNL